MAFNKTRLRSHVSEKISLALAIAGVLAMTSFLAVTEAKAPKKPCQVKHDRMQLEQRQAIVGNVSAAAPKAIGAEQTVAQEDASLKKARPANAVKVLRRPKRD